MATKSNLSKVLNRIAKEFEEEENDSNIEQVFIAIANEDDSLRVIPYDCKEKRFDNAWKTLGYLSQGFLTIASMIGIASELVCVKTYDETEFKRLYELTAERLDDDELEKVNHMIEDMLEIENKYCDKEEKPLKQDENVC